MKSSSFAEHDSHIFVVALCEYERFLAEELCYYENTLAEMDIQQLFYLSIRIHTFYPQCNEMQEINWNGFYIAVQAHNN